MKTNFPVQFQKVVDFVKKEKGTEVSISTSTCFISTMNEIVIHHNFDLERNGLIALLHEVGHALQPNSRDEWVNSYKNVDDTEQPRKFAMLQFGNEMDAWNRGEALISELGLEVDMKRFNSEKNDALLTYFKY